MAHLRRFSVATTTYLRSVTDHFVAAIVITNGHGIGNNVLPRLAIVGAFLAIVLNSDDTRRVSDEVAVATDIAVLRRGWCRQ